MTTASKEEPTAEQVIGEAPKNANEVWRGALTRFKGHDLVQLRAFVVQGRDGGAVSIATRNGITLRPAQIPSIIALLRKAHEEAQRRGLIDGARS
jgi:hypothetical protein